MGNLEAQVLTILDELSIQKVKLSSVCHVGRVQGSIAAQAITAVA